MNYLNNALNHTKQTDKIPGVNQVKNNAGGYVFSIDKWKMLDRFLFTGTEGGTYYVEESKLTTDNLDNLFSCIKEDGVRVIDRIVEISSKGLAPKNDPAILALAAVAAKGDLNARKYAYANFDKVIRIGTHLFTFMNFKKSLGGFGKGVRKAINHWYNGKDLDSLGYQLVKYKNREGWTHKDVLRITHPIPKNESYNYLYSYVTGKNTAVNLLPDIVFANDVIQNLQKVSDVVKTIKEYGLTREMVPTEFQKNVLVQDALLAKMPITALIRNLGAYTASGLLTPFTTQTNYVVERLKNTGLVHPITILTALKNYAAGRGFRGSLTWEPVAKIKYALNEAFYNSFNTLSNINKNVYIGVDISGSMDMQINNTNLTCAEASAALAMCINKCADSSVIKGFSSMGNGSLWGFSKMKDLYISHDDTLDSALEKTRKYTFGRTDCALPMLDAIDNAYDIDCFVIFTDNETYCGSVHPVQALNDYNRKFNKNAKLIVCAMTGTPFSIADPKNPNMLDICGFDSTIPTLINNFIEE